MAPKAKTLKPRRGEVEKPTETGLIYEASQMLDRFLFTYPDHPLADDAAFSQANALFSLKAYDEVVNHAAACVKIFPKSKFAGSFQYMVALGNFWLRQYDDALAASKPVAEGSSEDKNLATYITAQILHARGEPVEALKWYEKIRDQYPDARDSIAYFEQKKIELDEVAIFKPGDKAEVTLRFRNVTEAHIQLYRVDLMKLYLRERDLSDITDVNLAGIAPKHQLTVKLGDGKDFKDREKKVVLPVKDDGAYLMICRGDYLHTSGLALITPLKLEVQEENQGVGEVRVNVTDRVTGEFLEGVHMKAVGSEQTKKTHSGETDLRGVWKADGVKGKVTVLARDAEGRYAFYPG